jgi:hypothetical protein
VLAQADQGAHNKTIAHCIHGGYLRGVHSQCVRDYIQSPRGASMRHLKRLAPQHVLKCIAGSSLLRPAVAAIYVHARCPNAAQ